MTDLCGTCGAYWACDCPRGLRLDAERDDLAALVAENTPGLIGPDDLDGRPFNGRDPFALVADVILPRLP